MGGDDPEPEAVFEQPTKPHAEQTSRTANETSRVGYDFVDTESDEDLVKSPKDHQPKVYPMREITLNVPGSNEKLSFNLLVSVISLAFLWGMTIFCMVDPTGAKSELGRWFQTTIQYFTWFYIVGNPVMFAFIIWVAYRYGHIKLGHKDGQPEFSDISYFSMLFSAGVGVGLFFYGVSEPLWHQSSNYYANAGYHTQDEVDQWALEITMYHWGFAAWSPYLIMALATGLSSYCFDLPLTVRSTFYPIFGEYVWGWVGDLLDSWSIVMTVAGICTSLGLGTMQLTTGLQRLGWIPEKEDLSMTYVIIVWVITLFATISVVTGLKVGIKALSLLGFILGCLILFLCFVMEKSYYLMDLLVQTTGFYLQWSFFQVPFWTDAFAALEPGEGRAIDGKAGESWWIGSWTVFYMAWWVSWTCFVGIFIGRISKNRSIRSVVAGVFLAPTAYALVWFSIMGGIGLRQSRQALELEKLGEDYFQDATYFQSVENEFCFDVPQEDVYSGDELIFTNTLLGITPVCKFDSANSDNAWFNVMYSFSYPGTGIDGNFPGFGEIMAGLSIFALAVYFITSSDSGSLVVDALASNGKEEHHWLQRVFWAFTEGAVATGLLYAGGADALSALQAASIVFGLPYNFFVFFMCWTVYKMCQALEQQGQEDFHDPKVLLPKKSWTFPIYGGIFNGMESIFSCGRIHPAMKEAGIVPPPASDLCVLLKNVLFPFLSVYKIYSGVDMKKQNKKFTLFTTAVYACIHFLWIALFACGSINYGFIAFGWMFFFVNAVLLVGLRSDIRGKLGIGGNLVGDFIAGSFMYPQGLLQMERQLFEFSEIDKDAADKNSIDEDEACLVKEKKVSTIPGGSILEA
jgi:choline-glycine betaine transporter